MTLRNQVNRPTDKIDGSNVKDQVQFEFHVIVHQDICKDVTKGLQGNDFGFLCKPLFLNRYKHKQFSNNFSSSVFVEQYFSILLQNINGNSAKSAEGNCAKKRQFALFHLSVVTMMIA